MTRDVEWRPIPGFEAHYEVSSGGQVRRSNPLNAAGQRIRVRVLRPGVNRDGYEYVNLYVGAGRQTVTVHRLVAAAFHGPRSVGHDVDHVDGDKRNNAASNLEYVTTGENIRRALANGLSGGMMPETVKKIRRLGRDGMSSREIGKLYGIAYRSVRRILRGDRWGCVI